MAGADNDTLFGTGLDLSGLNPVVNRLGTNGFLYFGNSAGNPQAGLPTSVNDTIEYIGDEGTGRFENRRWITPFVVDASSAEGSRGTYTTIQAAIDAASSGDTIFVRPGTYTESPALIGGITLVALTERGATKPEIIGQCSITSGTANIKGLQLTENGSAAVACSSTGGVNIYNCALTCSTADLITNSGSGLIRVEYSSVNLLGNFKAFACSGSGGIFFRYCTGANTASTTASTHSGTGATVRVEHCNFPISFSTSGSCSTIFGTSSLDGGTRNITILTTAGTGNHSIHNCNVSSGTSSCVSVGSGTTLTTANTNYESSNTNAITGAGIVKAGDLTFSGTSSLINTTTQTELKEVHGPISFDGGTNYLEEYEEGTWTPALTGGGSAPTISYTNRFGYYVRIGSLVYYKWLMTVNTISGGSGATLITGLPFTTANDNAGVRHILSTSRVDWPASVTTVLQSIGQNLTVINLIGDIDNAGGVGLDIAGVANGDFLLGTGFYWV